MVTVAEVASRQEVAIGAASVVVTAVASVAVTAAEAASLPEVALHLEEASVAVANEN